MARTLVTTPTTIYVAAGGNDSNSGTLNLNASYTSVGSPSFTGSTVKGNSVVNTNGTKASIPGGITATTGGQINDSGSI